MERKTKVILRGLIFSECPRWYDNRCWFSDMLDKKVIAVDAEGNAETIAEVPGQPGGLGFLPDGRLLIVSMLDQKLLRLDPDGLTEVADLSNLAVGNCNDMVVDLQGRAYIGDWGYIKSEPGMRKDTAHQILVMPDGEASIVASNMYFPNGAVITEDNKTLIVAESQAYRLVALDIAPDGTLSNYRVWADLGEEVIPDGICLDAENAVWVTNANGNDVIRVREGGEVADRIILDLRSYSCILGGPERKTLYITSALPGLFADLQDKRSGCIEVVDVDVPGAGLP